MKLDFPAIDIQRSGKFKQANFDFGDKRVIMNILRSKMYSRPAYIICQEIMSNARDANREAGRGHLPIEITLPNQFCDQISFKDCGPGISPDRMENVFILYGNSTKRMDNGQTGGFGLGAKTPFSYTDSFNVTTITREANGNIKRVYIAYIDETQLGAMTLVSESPTTDETGTTISMAVRSQDIDEFVDCVSRVGKYWTVRPVVTGNKTFEWRPITYSVKGNGWALLSPNSYGEGSVILIDDISYSIRQSALFPSGHKIHDDSNINIIQNLSKNVHTVLSFSVGELAVTANREDIDYQPEVIEKIHGRLKVMLEEARKLISDKIKDSKNLWDATIAWNSSSSLFSTFGIKPQWNGLDVMGSYIDIYNDREYDWLKNIQIFEGSRDTKVSVFKMDSVTNEPILVKEERIRRRRRTTGGRPIRRISILPSWLVLMDEMGGTPDRARVHTALINNPSIVCVAVVSFIDQKAADWIEKKYNWSHLGFGLLADFARAPKIKKVRAGYEIHKVKKLEIRHTARGTTFDWAKDDIRTTADDTGGVYVIIREGELYISPKRKVSKARLLEIQKVLGCDIYGFLYKWSKNINPAWQSVFDVIKLRIEEQRAQPNIIHLQSYGTTGSIYELLPEDVVDQLDETKIKDGAFKTWLIASKKVRTSHDIAKKLNKLLGLLDKPTIDLNGGLLKWWRKKALNSYPLLRNMDRYGSKHGYAAGIIHYINNTNKE